MDFDYDLVTSLSPIFFLSLVVGLISAVSSGPVGERKISKGRYHWVYHICYLLIHLSFVVIAQLVWMDHRNSLFDKRFELFSIYTNLFISLVVLLCHHLFRNGLFRTLTEIYEIDKEMAAFGIKIDHRLVFRSTIGITLFLVVTAGWYCLISRQSTRLYEFYYIGLFAMQYFISMTMKSQFCILNICLKYRFLALDAKLKEVIYSTRIEPEKINNKIIMVRSADKNYENLSPLAEKIITLSEFHSKLYNISKRINLYFSVQILLITGKYFVEITATLYYNLQKFYKTGKEAEEPYDYFYAFTHFIWAVMNAIDLLILVYSSDSMCSAANNCKLTLHKVDLNSKDIEMKKEVTAFSLQLLHNDLVLTAAGFFNIDFTLIFNIIGAVTTYLVIFIQFDMSGNEKSANKTDTANLTAANSTVSPYTSLSTATGLLLHTTPNFTLAPP